MRTLFLGIFLAALLTTSAQADDMDPRTQELPACDSEEQIRRFIELGGDGKAFDLVNAEWNQRDSCAQVKVISMIQRRLGTVRDHAGARLDITEIIVIAMESAAGMEFLDIPVIWYSVTYHDLGV